MKLSTKLQKYALKHANIMLEICKSNNTLSSENVHAIRRRSKRIRASWQCVRTFDRETSNQENEQLRDLAKKLSPHRNQIVMVDLIAKLSDFSVAENVKHNISLKKEIPIPLDAIGICEKTIITLQNDWPEVYDNMLIKKGIGRMYKKACWLYRSTSQTKSEESSHKWRKWSKYLCFVIIAVSPEKPNKDLQKILNKLKKLSSELGEKHDLQVLKSFVEANIQDAKLKQNLINIITSKSDDIGKVTISKGKKIFSKDKRSFCKKIKRLLK